MGLIAALLSIVAALVGPASHAGGRAGQDGVHARSTYCDPMTGCTGGASFYANTSEFLLFVDLAAGAPRFSVVGPFGAQLTDLARTPDGRLYGVSFDTLYLIDQQTGRATEIGPLGAQDVNGLVWSGQGQTLLASSTDGSFYRVDAATGRAALVGQLGGAVTSSGDLCYTPDALYMTAPPAQGQATGDLLVRVDESTGSAAVVGSIGRDHVYGLAWVMGSLVGVTDSGEVVRIDQRTAAATPVGIPGPPFWGAS